MCSEAKGLGGWPRKAARWAVLFAAVSIALAAVLTTSAPSARGGEPPAPKPAPAADDPELPPAASADEPLAPAFSAAKAAGYLDAVALNWTRERRCGTCH